MSGFQTNKDLVWCADGVCRYKGSELVDKNFLNERYVSYDDLKRGMENYVSVKDLLDYTDAIKSMITGRSPPNETPILRKLDSLSRQMMRPQSPQSPQVVQLANERLANERLANERLANERLAKEARDRDLARIKCEDAFASNLNYARESNAPSLWYALATNTSDCTSAYSFNYPTKEAAELKSIEECNKRTALKNCKLHTVEQKPALRK